MVPTRDGLMLAAVLFAVGLAGLLVRRNVIFILMSIEVMLNAAGLAFVAAGARWGPAGRPGDVHLHPGHGRGGGLGGAGAGACSSIISTNRWTWTPPAG